MTTTKDKIIDEIEHRWRHDYLGAVDVPWMVNELRWVRHMLRVTWPKGSRPGWVSLVLGEESSDE